MVTPAVDGIDLFKIAGRSISGWIPSLKTGITIRQPFCSQLEERLLMWLEYHPQVVSYARGDIGPAFASAYRLPLPQHAPFAIGYAFESKPHQYLPDVVGTLTNGQPFIAEACAVDDFWLQCAPQWKVVQLATGKQRERAGHLCPSEMMTILIHFHLQTYAASRDCKRLFQSRALISTSLFSANMLSRHVRCSSPEDANERT